MFKIFKYYFFDIILFTSSSIFGAFLGILANDLIKNKEADTIQILLFFVGYIVLLFSCLYGNAGIKHIPINKISEKEIGFDKQFGKAFKKTILILLPGMILLILSFFYPSIVSNNGQSFGNKQFVFYPNLKVENLISSYTSIKWNKANSSTVNPILFRLPRRNSLTSFENMNLVQAPYKISNGLFIWEINYPKNIEREVSYMIWVEMKDKILVYYSDYIVEDNRSPDQPRKVSSINRKIHWRKSKSLDVSHYIINLRLNNITVSDTLVASDTSFSLKKRVIPGKYFFELITIDSSQNRSILRDSLLIK